MPCMDFGAEVFSGGAAEMTGMSTSYSTWLLIVVTGSPVRVFFLVEQNLAAWPGSNISSALQASATSPEQ